MITDIALNVIDQVVQHKLDYSRQLLKEYDLPHTGDRSKLRERLIAAVDNEHIEVTILQELLNELDLWGNQKVRWMQFRPELLSQFQNEQHIITAATQVGMSDLIDAEVSLVPPDTLTPMTISYEEKGNGRYLKLAAAKTQVIREEQKHIPVIRNEEQFPGVVYIPFKENTKKVMAFAEINLDNGFSMISVTLIRQGSIYVADFNDFYCAFAPLLSLGMGTRLNLFEATKSIQSLTHQQVRLVGRRSRTSSGGTINCSSHSRYADMRTDYELSITQSALPDAPGVYCNCYWNPCDDLDECVHTHLYGPEGEVSIIGEVTEASVRYVLQRILKLNYR